MQKFKLLGERDTRHLIVIMAHLSRIMGYQHSVGQNSTSVARLDRIWSQNSSVFSQTQRYIYAVGVLSRFY